MIALHRRCIALVLLAAYLNDPVPLFLALGDGGHAV